MKIMKAVTVCLITVLLALGISACSGTETTTAPSLMEDAPNFRFLLSDDVNAIDDFSSVNVTISKIGVQQGGESGSWLEFTPDVTEVDLKPLTGENALEIWSGNLSPGTYSKVFIYVTEVKGILIEELGGERTEVQLPSNKLQISKPFTIGENATTSFVYDITVIKAGGSGKYLIQPQIAESGADQKFKEVKPGSESESDDEDDIEDEEPEEKSEDDAVTEETSREIAQEFVKESPTFEYDGVEDTLTLVETVALETDASWNFVYTFDSLHAGYGDRSGEIVAEVITPHEAVITVEGGEIVSAVMDEAWDMIDQAEIDG